MNATEIRKRFSAARDLLDGSTTTRAKFSAAKNLIQGIRPELDAVLTRCDESLTTLEKVQSGDVVELAAEKLPENTEEEKKRKRALLLLIRSWDQLKDEMARVEAELNSSSSNSGQSDTSSWVRILSASKGPLGVITVLAIGAVMLKTSVVDLTVFNDGCSPLVPASSIPVPLPGIVLPSEPILAGENATFSIPPLSLEVDGMSQSALTLRSLGFSISIQLSSSIKDVTYDGETLLKKKKTISLGGEGHALRIVCK